MRIAALVPLIACVPASAQTRPPDQGDRTGHVASSSVGQVGQRKTRDEFAPNVTPMGRIVSRVQNRVQSRIHSRIDRYYNPQVNVTSPIEAAGERTRKTAQLGRR